MDRHGFEFFKLKRSANRRVLDQRFGDFAKPDLIGRWAQLDAPMGWNDQPMFDRFGAEFPVFFDNLIDNALARALHAGSEEGLQLVAVVFNFDDAGIGAWALAGVARTQGWPIANLPAVS